jgi:DNA topoisomerase I
VIERVGHRADSPRSHRTRRKGRGIRVAALRYSCSNGPGMRRQRKGHGFCYIRRDGRVVRNSSTLKRIRRLAIPPAWKDVWICGDARGHIQATGRDARGRKQYRYHPEWRVARDRTKFDRMSAFGAVLPRIRARVAADLARPGLRREKVLAVVVRLLQCSLIRVGNEEYARTNRSFGLTTMRDSHVKIGGGIVRFEFRGKSGRRHSVGVDDARLARIVKQCRELPGQELFQYLDNSGARRDITSGDVNEYVREIAGADFTAKDFRTWAGTVMAVTALRDITPPHSAAHAKRNVLRATDVVAGMLGNTRAVCRRSYIHPAIVDAYIDRQMFKGGRPVRRIRRMATLRIDEAMVLDILKQAS